MLNFDAFQTYPHVSGEYGIDFKKLDTTNVSMWRTESGRIIYGCITDNFITVLDDDPSLIPNWKGRKLYANYITKRSTVKFDLKTKEESSSERHRDFFAAAFVESAIKFFETNKGPVRRWEAEWLQGSDNYQQFYNLQKQGLSSLEAARLTWTGQLATKLGFSLREQEPVLGLVDGTPMITCVFER